MVFTAAPAPRASWKGPRSVTPGTLELGQQAPAMGQLREPGLKAIPIPFQSWETADPSP